MKVLRPNFDYATALDECIYSFISKEVREIKHIIMHPNSFHYLISQLRINEDINMNELINIKYRGYKIFRSLDIEECCFEIG